MIQDDKLSYGGYVEFASKKASLTIAAFSTVMANNSRSGLHTSVRKSVMRDDAHCKELYAKPGENTTINASQEAVDVIASFLTIRLLVLEDKK